ncbi:DUF2232 domain-containing protein [Gemmatimonadota bacterium]
MNQEHEGGIASSYWGRFVPASLAVVGAGMLLLPLPLLNTAGAVGTPAVLMILFLRREEGSTMRWAPALISGAMATMVVPGMGLMALCLVLTAVLIDAGIRRGMEWKLVGTIASSPVLIWAVIGIPFWAGADTTIRDDLVAGMAPMIERFQSLGLDPAALEEATARTMDLFMSILPSQIAIVAVFVGFGALLAGNWWMKREEVQLSLDIPPFTTWELPFHFVWGMVGGLVIWASGLLIPGWKTVAMIGLNLVIVASLFYLIQGLAIVWYNFEIRGTPRWFRALFAIVVVTLIFPGVILLGILENWVPFRRLMAGAGGSGTIEEDE